MDGIATVHPVVHGIPAVVSVSLKVKGLKASTKAVLATQASPRDVQ
jgi:hypothetical protein